MTVAVPEGLGGLSDMAEQRLELAPRVVALVRALLAIAPASREWDRRQSATATESLLTQGVVTEAEAAASGADSAGLSTLAVAALDRALAPDFSHRGEVGDATVTLAIGLGRRFDPDPTALLDLFRRSKEIDSDLARRIAWLATRRGGVALGGGLSDVLFVDTESVLSFLDAAVVADAEGPVDPLKARPAAGGVGAPAPRPPLLRVPSLPRSVVVLSAGAGKVAKWALRGLRQPRLGDRGSEPWGFSEPPEGAEAPAGSAGPEAAPVAAAAPEEDWDPIVVSGPSEAAPPTAEPPSPVLEPRPAKSRRSGAGQKRSGASIPSRPHAVVSTGVAAEVGGKGLPAKRTLAQGRQYQFFVEIGRTLTPDALDGSATPLPDLPESTVLQVALFGFKGELAPEPGADVGELRLLGNGTAVVEAQPGGACGQTRLHLPFTTPDRVGLMRMRCNIYCRQVLLQSRLIEAEVADEERAAARRVLRSTLDFAVVADLRREHLEGLEHRTLSVLINDNGDGTHGFRFFGGTEFKQDVTLTGQQLDEAIDYGQGGLRLASWATEDEPTKAEFDQLRYRYSSPTVENLKQDLIILARRGFALWDQLIFQLSGGDVDALRQRMRNPGVVELANKESLDLLVPAALIYDYPLDIEDDRLTVCPVFVAMLGKMPLAGAPCFQGQCPHYDDPLVVCPGGFWGFRHEIGYSASLTGGRSVDAHDHGLVIGTGAAPVFTVGASADPKLVHRDDHLVALHQLAGDQWNFALGRTDLFGLFRTTTPSIVYLYGHGGRKGPMPFFEVGSGADGPILRASLQGKAEWRTSRPLVFLNGCHTAALAPDAAFSYATGFLQTAHASAVIGTEIAVFEKLAVAFGEGCLRHLVADRQPLGAAVRATRLALLEDGVPLGLVYLAFGPSELRLAEWAPSAPVSG